MIIKAKEKKDLIDVLFNVDKTIVSISSNYNFIFNGYNGNQRIRVESVFDEDKKKYNLGGGIAGYESITLEIPSKKYKKVIL